ncbi:MAG TPA: Fic family protein [Kiritimatiellia bacterium]|nr:MAG: Adenosine monophosphate-protein transferase NmFic [Verrucomicrobia bacterium ADurb.Bin018]HOD99754.1 Fic family protein [Kiritimatiellia bacterium]HOE36176.1 Fic family protein [Kiritimatiellia bacterium]HOR73810.1 Fic family protein [Kiritimatiellia bacterium]HOU58156.1 Fic family protein [Kiritimatiellia bacterium]
MSKLSIRFFNDRKVRAVWDNANAKWWFAAVDVVAILSESANPANYWRVLKSRLTAEKNETITKCNAFKLRAPDGKLRLTDCLDSDGVLALAKNFPGNKARHFLDWFLYSDNTTDGQSKKKAYSLFESGILQSLEPGTIKCLQQIHAYIFGGLYDFAGQIRTKNISKGGFTFANARHLPATLASIEAMPETTFDEILDKYVEMNVAHPFMEGNGRATRIWFDMMLKRSLRKCVDWSKINKNAYHEAMRQSISDSTKIKALVQAALTNKISDRATYMKGIDYSYYYEQDPTP